jgi:membrane-bound lytic murein transglycosylase F
MGEENRYDDLIRKYADRYSLPWLLIKAQVWAESNFNPNAISKCGARGLMQLMPDTDFWLDHDYDGFDPEGSIDNGVRFDRWLFSHFPEIPDLEERMKFMLASYNCGRGYVNRALHLAQEDEFGFKPLAARPGKWQTWNYTCRLLASPECFVEIKGKKHHADFLQVWDYVEKIWKRYQKYRESDPGRQGDAGERNGSRVGG